MKVLMLKVFFFSFYPAAVYKGNDDSAISAAVEVLMKSSLSVFTYPGLWIHIAEHAFSPTPQTPCFVSWLQLNLTTNFFTVTRLGFLGIMSLFSLLLSCSALTPHFSSSPSTQSTTYGSFLRVVMHCFQYDLPFEETQWQELLRCWFPCHILMRIFFFFSLNLFVWPLGGSATSCQLSIDISS